VTLGDGIQQYQSFGTPALLNLIASLQAARCHHNGNIVCRVHHDAGMKVRVHEINDILLPS
jgi:hypothetical protein